MAEHITTYTGTRFYPTDPDPRGLHIRDIAHALSLICRGNGQVRSFWSVGQHCLQCAREAEARGLSDRVVVACLVHDASEAYLSDVPRPFKKELPGYRACEERLLSMVYERFVGSGLTEEEQRALKQIDDDLLYYDLKFLLNDPPAGEAPRLRAPLSYDFVPFAQVEEAYLEMFRRYRPDWKDEEEEQDG